MCSSFCWPLKTPYLSLDQNVSLMLKPVQPQDWYTQDGEELHNLSRNGRSWSIIDHQVVSQTSISYVVKSEARNELDAHEGKELLKSRNIWQSIKQETWQEWKLRFTFTRSKRRPDKKMLDVRSTLIVPADVFFVPTLGQDVHSFLWPRLQIIFATSCAPVDKDKMGKPKSRIAF